MVPVILENTARTAEVTFGVVLIRNVQCLAETRASQSLVRTCSVPALPFVVVVEDATLPVVADTVEELSSTSVCYGSRCGYHTLVSAPRSSHRGLNVVFYLALDPFSTVREIRLQIKNQQALW